MYAMHYDTSKIKVTNKDYYTLILIVWCMKLKPKLLWRFYWERIKKCLILVILQPSQNIIMIWFKRITCC